MRDYKKAKHINITRILGDASRLKAVEEYIDLNDNEIDFDENDKVFVIVRKDNPNKVKLIPYSAILEIDFTL